MKQIIYLFTALVLAISFNLFTQSSSFAQDAFDEETVRVDKKENKEAEGTKAFSVTKLGLLGVYDITAKKPGIETRFSISSNHLYLPFEWQYIFKGSIRMRAWPQFFFKKRKNEQDPAVFLSFYTSGRVKSGASEASDGELGPGGGFSGGGFVLAAWITGNFYQGNPTVKDLFSFRARVEINPTKSFYAMFNMKIGTAVVKGTSVSTSATTFEAELEVSYIVWNNLAIIAGIEARVDNLGGILSGSAKVAGISDAIQAVGKFGITFKL